MKKLFYLLGGVLVFVALTISCEKSSLESMPNENGISNSTEVLKKPKVTICHKSNKKWKTISVSENAVDAHLAHGDYLGSCNDGCSLKFYQGFHTDTNGWSDIDDSWYGQVTRVESGDNGINSSMGNYHAIFEGDGSSAPFTRFEGYSSVWPGSWMAEVDVYLDPSWGTSQGFDYSVAASGSDGNHQRDFIFHVNHDASTGKLLVAGSNNTNFAPREDLESLNHYEVTVAGWYTLQHYFYDNGGVLAVDLNLLDADGNVLFTETRTDPSDVIATEIGGNRYGWFTFINVTGGIAVDETKHFVCNN
jgi:hypothetical protein